MSVLFLLAAVAVVLLVVAVTEIAAAVLPTLIVLFAVPAEERAELTALMEAGGRRHTRRFGVSTALRIARVARRSTGMPEPQSLAGSTPSPGVGR